MERDTKSIEARLVDAAKAIGWGIAKDGSIRGMYDYTSSAGTLRKVGPALAAQGIAVTVDLDLAPQSTVEAVMLKVSVTYRAEGCEPLTTCGYGVGKASGARDEKALLKAQSSGIKYAHILAFSIAMGFDPEEDDSKKEERPGPKCDDVNGFDIAKIVKHIDGVGDPDRLRAAEDYAQSIMGQITNDNDRLAIVEAIARATSRVKESSK